MLLEKTPSYLKVVRQNIFDRKLFTVCPQRQSYFCFVFAFHCLQMYTSLLWARIRIVWFCMGF